MLRAPPIAAQFGGDSVLLSPRTVARSLCCALDGHHRTPPGLRSKDLAAAERIIVKERIGIDRQAELARWLAPLLACLGHKGSAAEIPIVNPYAARCAVKR